MKNKDSFFILSILLSCLFLFFTPLTLLATLNEPLRMQLLSGYRNDHIHSHAEEFNQIQFWENSLSLKAIHRDLTFYARGSGSAFGDGSGWALDGTSYIGYGVNLTPDRFYTVVATPLGGFSGHYETIRSYRQTWYGPFIGGSIYAIPGGSLSFEVGYAYHWLHLRLHTEAIKHKESGNHGQSGWAEVDWRVAKEWQVGALGTIEYYFSQANLNLRFTSISVLFTISRQL